MEVGSGGRVVAPERESATPAGAGRGVTKASRWDSFTRNAGIVAAAVLVAAIVVASVGGPSAARKSKGRPGAAGTNIRRTAPVRAAAPISRERDSPVRRAAGRRTGGRRVWAHPHHRYVPLGRLDIPRIGLHVHFYAGVYDDVVELGPGLWPGTPLPGMPGNAVFAGHRTTYTHPFGQLDLLHRGDIIRARIGGHRATRFEVFRTAVVPEARYASYVLRRPPDPRARWITLFACTPKGYRTHRIVVQGRAKEPTGQSHKRGGTP